MTRRQHNREISGLLATAIVAVAVTSGCAAPTEDPVPAPVNAAEAADLQSALDAAPVESPSGAVVVRLAFGAGADLDLFVSDPRRETVYFANRRAASGGRLAEDQRCDAPAPRIETVRFEQALPGRYRIGIDHPGSCDGEPAEAVFVVEWRIGDGPARRVTGSVAPLVFDSIVQEFDLPPPS
jgi:hypothetical protein